MLYLGRNPEFLLLVQILEKFSFSNSQVATVRVDGIYILTLREYRIDEIRGRAAYSYYLYQTCCFLTLFPGWFYDWTQTYDIAFYFSGFCVLLGGFVLLLASLPPWETCNRQLPKPAPTTFLYKVASHV